MWQEDEQPQSQAIDENSNDAYSNSSTFEVEEDGLEKEEFVDEDGNLITPDQVHDSLAEVLRKHQERLSKDLEDMKQKGSFEEEGVLLCDEEYTQESNESESE